eukprot:gene23224-30104_t
MSQNMKNNRSSGGSGWRTVAVCILVIVVPWALYVNVPMRRNTGLPPGLLDQIESAALRKKIEDIGVLKETSKPLSEAIGSTPVRVQVHPKPFVLPDLPVQGPIPSEGAVPLFGVKHKGTDAIFALACNYPKIYYQRFVGSLRLAGYEDDIVLAVSPVEKMKPGVLQYVKDTKVVAYGFDVDCDGPDNCKLKDDFLGYPDPRPLRTFANIRYALYEYWLRQYDRRSYILILDFRDTFFQAKPFLPFGPFESRPTDKFDLQVFAENWSVKTIGICVFNSMWVSKCFGKPALPPLK